jgi:hypothetical protein
MATSFSGGRSRSAQREPSTMDKQLVNFITYGCESSAPLFVIYKAGREPRRIKFDCICYIRYKDMYLNLGILPQLLHI